MLRLAFALSLVALPLRADAPRVVTDILPVHGIVAAILGDLAEPDLIVEPSMSAHHVALRPSMARSLQDADLVVYIGPELTPWLAKATAALAGQATALRLLQVPGTHLLGPREEAVFSEDDGHDDHAHEVTQIDPHAWLDPDNALVWADAIATELARIDPDNAAIYRANTDDLRNRIMAVRDETEATLSPSKSKTFAVYHDAYQYFESHFELASIGSILTLNAESASASRVQAISLAAQSAGIVCLFSEPQFPDRLTAALKRDLGVRSAYIDPLGAAITPGPDAYPTLIRTLGASIAECLTPSS